MNQNTSFRMARIPRTGKYLASFKRGWKSGWMHYRQAGTFREFDTWDSAWQFLLEKCQGNAAFLATHFCGADPLPPMESPVTPDKDVFAMLCDAATSHKDELVDVQMFYFLRGCLYAWCVEHNESVMEMEELFMQDVHYLARHNSLQS